MKMKKEIRMSQIQTANLQNDDDNQNEKMTVDGTAVVFEQRTELCKLDGVSYYEVIDAHALDGVDLTDCCMRYNHADGFSILARTRNKSLRLNVDERGLHFSADIVDTQQCRDIFKLVNDGLVDACSFGFTVKEDRYDPETRTRRILKFDRVFEISLVDMPAYDGTSVQVSQRDYFQAKHEAEQKAQNEQRRKRLILMTY